jgi:hypothetical protein
LTLVGLSEGSHALVDEFGGKRAQRRRHSKTYCLRGP